MASYTKHYGFIKPDKSEHYDIDDVENNNIDKVDEVLYGKEEKQPGKSLSTNDFTDEYKKKLDGLNNYDDTDVKDNIASNTKSIKTIQEEQETQNKEIENINKKNKEQDEELKAIKEKDNSQDKEIESLKSKIVELKAENVALKSQIPDGEAEGSVIHLSDSSDLLCEIVPIGNAEQEVRKGYNLLNPSNLEIFNSNKYISTIGYYNTGIIEVEPDTIYSLVRKKDGTFSDAGYFLYDTTNSNKTNITSSSIENVVNGNHKVTKFMTNSDTGYFGFYLGETEKTYTSVEECLLSNGMMLLKGDYLTATIPDYEQYGATPSPEFESPIKTVGQNVNLSEVNEITIESYSSNPTNVTGFIETSKLPITIQFKQSNNESYLGYIRFYDENKAYLGQTQYSNSLHVAKGLTITENMYNAKYVAYTIKGTEGTNTFPLEITKIKTEQGTEPTGYSPYGQGSVQIGVCDENILKNTATSKSVNGVDFTVNDDGTVVVNGTATANADFSIGDVELRANSYMLSGAPNTSAGNTYKLIAYDYGSTFYSDVGSGAKITPSTAQKHQIFIRVYSGQTVNNVLFKPMINLGTEIKPFAPHEGYIESLPTQKEFVKIGEKEDTFVKINGKLYEKHYFGKRVYDENSDWMIEGSNIFYINTPIENVKVNTDIKKCNIQSAVNSANERFSFSASRRFNLITNKIEHSVDAIKEYAKNQNVVIYFELEEPELIECTELQEEILNKFHTYKNVTNIWCDGIGTIKVNYTQDLKTYIDNQINSLATAIVNNS